MVTVPVIHRRKHSRYRHRRPDDRFEVSVTVDNALSGYKICGYRTITTRQQIKVDLRRIGIKQMVEKLDNPLRVGRSDIGDGGWMCKRYVEVVTGEERPVPVGEAPAGYNVKQHLLPVRLKGDSLHLICRITGRVEGADNTPDAGADDDVGVYSRLFDSSDHPDM